MDILHLVTTSAPDLTTARDNKPALLLSWWCTCYAIAVIVIRFCGRYVRAEKVFLEDGIMCLAITPLLIRMTFVHFVLRNGTNNTVTDGLSTSDISRRELGSQLVLAARLFYAAYLWAIKYSTTLFLGTLSESVSQGSHRRTLRYLHIFLALTFLATIIADLGACTPFSHYWQVVPDPGPACRAGEAHLYTMGVLHVVTNVALVCFPIPIVWRSKISGRRKFSILIQLSLPLLSIALTSFSLPHITTHKFSQQTRSLYASLDILLSTFISNSIVLFSLLSDRGYKKTKYKYKFQDPASLLGNGRDGILGGSGMGGMGGKGRERWGSDEDLILDDGSGGKGAKGGVELRNLGGVGVGGGVGGVGRDVVGDGGVDRNDRNSGSDGNGVDSVNGAVTGVEKKENKKIIGKEGVLKRPESVKFGDIRVNSTWEIRVEER